MHPSAPVEFETPTALQVLRERTAPLHARLDGESALSRLVDPRCSLADYGRAMTLLAAAYAGIDPSLSAGARFCPPGLPPYAPRLPPLSADLRRLSITPPVAPVCTLPTPANRASYLGMRYVIEGSSLGARVIYSALLESVVAQYLAVDQSFWSLAKLWQTAWPAVLKQLAEVSGPEEQDDAANSACLVFEHFIRVLTPIR